jgi:hypothetical protein
MTVKKTDSKFNAEYIQKRCFNLLVWTLQHFTSKLQHFFITHNRTFDPFFDEVKFWDIGYQINTNSKEYAEKIKHNLYDYWEERYKPFSEETHPFRELARDLLDPTSSLCKALKIGDNVLSEEDFGLHLELIGAAVGHLIASEALSANNKELKDDFDFQNILDLAFKGEKLKTKLYKSIKDTSLVAILSYNVKKTDLTKGNLYIYLAQYLYARLSSSFKIRLPIGYLPILLPLRGLGQWRAVAGWICPTNKQLKDHLRLVRKAQPESLVSAIEEIYSVNLIEVFIFLLEDVLSKPSDSSERMKKAANVFSGLWISEEVKFYRDNALVLSYQANKDQISTNLVKSSLSSTSDSLVEKSKFLTIEEDLDCESTIILNLNKHPDVYFLRRALGFDLIIYKNCPRLKLNLLGQEEYWEVQLKERLSRTAGTIIKEQYFLTQGLTHEIMNTLSRRSRYRVLYAKALNNDPLDSSEVLYTCSILQELYYLTDAIRTVTKFDNPKAYLTKLASGVSSFDLTEFAFTWSATIEEIVQQILFGVNYLGYIPVTFHTIDCVWGKDCACPLLRENKSFSQMPTFAPFSIEATSLFAVGIHEVLGNAIQYLTKQKGAKNKIPFLMDEPLDCKIDVQFSLCLENDEFYELKFGNPINRDEKPSELSDGLKRTQNLLSCFVFQDKFGEEKKLIEFCLVDDKRPNYHCIAIKFRPQIVFL